MEIQKVFSDYYDTERMYSVLMSEDELRLFSKIQDLDYIADQETRKKEVRHAGAKKALKYGGIGALLGVGMGEAAEMISDRSEPKNLADLLEKRRGHPKNSFSKAVIGAALGAGSGAALGYYRGNKRRKNVEKDVDKRLEDYNKANESEKAYLRERDKYGRALELRKQHLDEMKEMNAWNALLFLK